ncbi:helix-turn-helix domain-containing protein [Kribbella sp. NPDC051952]|uniref:GlxA family transcriptional regulator n=1 Tax=Kribbella sp. NPDC051952 TaxID=3154851 RepID=UPI003441A50B
MSITPSEPQIRTRRVAFVVYDGVTLLDVTGPLEVLHQANRDSPRYETVLVSPTGGEVRAASGVTLAGTVSSLAKVDAVAQGSLAPGSLAEVDAVAGVDTVVVAGADHLVDRVPDEVLKLTAELAEGAGRVTSVCSGAFVLAALGLLDGRRATTHWRHAAAMARQYPEVAVEPDALHISDGRYITSAGISAGIDLALALVEADHGAEVARSVARELVVYLQRPGGQSQFSTAIATPPARSDVLRVATDAVVADPAGDHSLSRLAASAAVSARHLTRLFHSEFRTTPSRWVERVRLDRAQQLLLDGHSITTAARLSGLGSDETLRRAFARHVGTTPTEYLKRFHRTARS